MNIVLMGPSGAGKTAVASQLQANLQITRISTGDIARQLAEQDQVTSLDLARGDFAPEAAMRHIVQERLSHAERTIGGWVLDGFPRTVSQLVCLMQWTSGLPVFYSLDVPDWICIERLVRRARADDIPDAIAQKIEHWHRLTMPAVQILRAGGVLHKLDGTWPIDDLAAYIEKDLA